jgi:hypothetical protein
MHINVDKNHLSLYDLCIVAKFSFVAGDKQQAFPC